MITNPGEEYFKDGLWGWKDDEWLKLSMLWGYSARLSEELGEVKSGDGQYSQYITVVPSGEIHVIQFFTIRNNTGNRGATQIRLYDSSNYFICAYDPNPVRYVPLIYDGSVVLKEGDKVRFQMSNCLDGDNIEAGVWGYKMIIS